MINGAILPRVADALSDPARRDRAVPVLLFAFTAAWTLYGVLAKLSQDLHPDMTEIFSWSQHLALGYSKHPPLAPYLVRGWFSVFPAADWSFYLLAIAMAALALWIAWRIALRYLDGEKSAAALLLLTFIPFFNFHALKFNANTVLMPVWAATTLWFLISFETRSKFYAVLAGAGAAGSMLGKYWSVFLLLGLGLAALADSRRAPYFRSAAPYLTVAAGAIVLAPHVMWLFANDFAPFTYAATLHSAKSFGVSVAAAFGYLGGALGYAAPPLVLAAILFRPRSGALRDVLLPPREWLLVTLAFWLPLLLPALIAPLTGTTLNSLWSMSAWSLFGVVLLRSPKVEVTRRALAQLLVFAIAWPAIMIAAAPGIAYAIQRAGLHPLQAHVSLLAPDIERAWRKSSSAPLPRICGDAGLAYGAAFYLPAHPPSCDGFVLVSPREGGALVCFDDEACKSAIGRALRGHAGAHSSTVTLTRRYLGVTGAPQGYVIGIIPPQP